MTSRQDHQQRDLSSSISSPSRSSRGGGRGSRRPSRGRGGMYRSSAHPQHQQQNWRQKPQPATYEKDYSSEKARDSNKRIIYVEQREKDEDEEIEVPVVLQSQEDDSDDYFDDDDDDGGSSVSRTSRSSVSEHSSSSSSTGKRMRRRRKKRSTSEEDVELDHAIKEATSLLDSLALQQREIQESVALLSKKQEKITDQIQQTQSKLRQLVVESQSKKEKEAAEQRQRQQHQKQQRQQQQQQQQQLQLTAERTGKRREDTVHEQDTTMDDLDHIVARMWDLVEHKKVGEALALVDRKIPRYSVPADLILSIFRSLSYPREIPELVADRAIDLFMGTMLSRSSRPKLSQFYIEQRRLLAFYDRTFGSRAWDDMARNINSIIMKSPVKLSKMLPNVNSSDYKALMVAQSALSVMILAEPKMALSLLRIYDPLFKEIVLQNLERTLSLHQMSLEIPPLKGTHSSMVTTAITTGSAAVAKNVTTPSEQRTPRDVVENDVDIDDNLLIGENEMDESTMGEEGDDDDVNQNRASHNRSSAVDREEIAEAHHVMIPITVEDNNIVTQAAPISTNISAIDAEAQFIYGNIKPDQGEEANRIAICGEVEMICKRIFPDCTVHVYGSSASGFGLKGADIDICIKMHDTIASDPRVQGKHLVALFKEINRSNSPFPHIRAQQPVLGSRVPVLIIKDSKRQIQCDICVDNYLGVLNTGMLRQYSMIDERVKELVYVVKHWTKRRNIADPPSGSLSSYSYVLMVLFFLQSLDPPIVPSLQAIARSGDIAETDISQPTHWNAYDCRFFNNQHTLKDHFSGNLDNQVSLGELVVRFFDFYVNQFHFNEKTISVREGHSIPKIHNGSTISIEDPFEKRELGSVVSEKMAPVILDEFKRAYTILTSGGSLSEVVEMRRRGKTEHNLYQHKDKYEEHMDRETVLELLEQGKLFKGVLRVNKKRFHEAYVTVPGIEKDLYIDGLLARNRAIHGDIVAVKVLDDKEETKVSFDHLPSTESPVSNSAPVTDAIAESPESTFQVTSAEHRTGSVVYIMEKKSPRFFACRIMPESMGLPGKGFCSMIPLDKAFPKIRVPFVEFHSVFDSKSNHLEELLFLCEINFPWKESSHYPKGRIVGALGLKHDMYAQKRAIALQYMPNLYDSVFRDEVRDVKENANMDTATASFHAVKAILQEQVNDVEIDFERDEQLQQEYKDWRRRRVFTIDPSQSRDLDDALSIEKISDNEFHVTVYVADVCRFVKEGDAIDLDARKRGTSVYMIDQVEHMFDPHLSQNLCSILPGVTRFALCVEFKMTSDAEIVKDSVEFSRAVIKSCCRLDYDTVQNVLDKRALPEQPLVTNGFTWNQIYDDLMHFNDLAQKLRHKRMMNGALFLNTVELYFNVDEDGFPSGCHKSNHSESHQLIEEFMLTANSITAEALYHHYGADALLRNHVEPPEESWRTTLNILVRGLQQQNSNIAINVDQMIEDKVPSQEIMTRFIDATSGNPELSLCVMSAINKEMQLAKYVRAGDLANPSALRHYALNTDFYTHFTSPIRRYSDVIVHRQVLAMIRAKKENLEIGQLSEEMRGESLTALAEHLNDQSYGAKQVEDNCQKQYLALHLLPTMSKQIVREEAIVVSLGKRSFTVYIPKYGIDLRVDVMKQFVPLPDEIKELEEHDGESVIRVSAESPADLDQELEEELEEENKSRKLSSDVKKGTSITRLTFFWNRDHMSSFSKTSNYPRTMEITRMKRILVDLGVDTNSVPYNLYVYAIWDAKEQVKDPSIYPSRQRAISRELRSANAPTSSSLSLIAGCTAATLVHMPTSLSASKFQHQFQNLRQREGASRQQHQHQQQQSFSRKNKRWFLKQSQDQQNQMGGRWRMEDSPKKPKKDRTRSKGRSKFIVQEE